MSSRLETANELLERLKEKYQEKKEERDKCCRHLAALSGVIVPDGADPLDTLDDCREMAEVRHDQESRQLIAHINNHTLDMRKLEELIRNG